MPAKAKPSAAVAVKAPSGAAKGAKPKGAPANKGKAGAGRKVVAKKTRKIRTSVQFHRPHTLRTKAGEKAKYKRGPAHSKELNQYRIIKHPLTTESAMKKIEDQNTLVFIVDILANKHQIADAVKKLYDIKAIRVHTLIRPDGRKKALIKLDPKHDALDVSNKIGIL
eukprot:NODE_5824_length_673_cov_63.024038_g4927_i0.p2 GENE.NODE_5824_length_673_cov_63.024038_g4927_i0~~NODE_5824_length_673_cov_63.024038_g4927_i0.p2  ORF type:complete len:167 (+),score=69.34 NODE_5824_length_673_cov_63.024038_g4927_i0:122-622(+)